MWRLSLRSAACRHNARLLATPTPTGELPHGSFANPRLGIGEVLLVGQRAGGPGVTYTFGQTECVLDSVIYGKNVSTVWTARNKLRIINNNLE